MNTTDTEAASEANKNEFIIVLVEMIPETTNLYLVKANTPFAQRVMNCHGNLVNSTELPIEKITETIIVMNSLEGLASDEEGNVIEIKSSEELPTYQSLSPEEIEQNGVTKLVKNVGFGANPITFYSDDQKIIALVCMGMYL